MTRIRKLFEQKQPDILALFYTAGYPRPSATVEIGSSLAMAGIRLLEIGFPFSDSLVDGPTIQVANESALKQGMTFERYFTDFKNLRQKTDAALVCMCCLNPVLQYGVEHFCRDLSDAGGDGVIIADLPPEEFEHSYRSIFRQYNLDTIMLVTAHLSDDRIRYIDSLCSGFLYVVSSDATTGEKLNVDKTRKEYFERLRSLDLRNPLMIGFGISDNTSFKAACEFAHGAIIGSAFIREISKNHGNIDQLCSNFVKKITEDSCS